MGMYASEVIKQATAWIGKKESDGTHKSIIDLYNSHKPLARNYKVKYTDSWCAVFVSAVSIKLGYTKIIPVECSCQKMIALFKKLGCWVENENVTPKKGWVIFYYWKDGKDFENNDCKGWANHTGIVERVANGKITVMEGNYGNAVKRRTLKVNGQYIRGYGVPKYDTEPKKSVSTVAKEVISGKWGNNPERKKRLEEAGYNYYEVQKKVNELLKIR